MYVQKSTEQLPLFVDGKVDPELKALILQHNVIEKYPLYYEQIERLFNQAKKLFGSELSYAKYEVRHDRFFNLTIYRTVLTKDSVYRHPHNHEILIELYGSISYDTNQFSLRARLFLYSAIATEVMQTESKYDSHQARSTYPISTAIHVLKTYQNRLTRFVKKHSLKRDEITTFANALELYSAYAKVQGAQLNVVNYLARSVKAGMNAEKAVWMVYNRFSVDLAEFYKDVPTSWVHKI